MPSHTQIPSATGQLTEALQNVIGFRQRQQQIGLERERVQQSRKIAGLREQELKLRQEQSRTQTEQASERLELSRQRLQQTQNEFFFDAALTFAKNPENIGLANKALELAGFEGEIQPITKEGRLIIQDRDGRSFIALESEIRAEFNKPVEERNVIGVFSAAEPEILEEDKVKPKEEQKLIDDITRLDDDMAQLRASLQTPEAQASPEISRSIQDRIAIRQRQRRTLTERLPEKRKEQFLSIRETTARQKIQQGLAQGFSPEQIKEALKRTGSKEFVNIVDELSKEQAP